MSDAIDSQHYHQSTPSQQPATSNACLTTYIFNPADSLAPSPERRDDSPTVGSYNQRGPILHHHQHHKHGQFRSHQHQVSNASTATVKSVSPDTLQLTLDRKSLGHCNYMAEYDPDVVVVGGGAGGTMGKKFDNSFEPLYTISSHTTATEERTYDEPCTGDLHRRSWLCCPGEETRTSGVETLGAVEPPPLLGDHTRNKDHEEGDIIAAQPTHNGGGTTVNGFCRSPYERLQEQLDDQARGYEEQLTELHSVIAELTRKLHQQRSMAIQEEEEMMSDISTSVHDDSLTCPLEVSELDHGDLSDLENKRERANILLADSPLELPCPKLILPPPPPTTHSPLPPSNQIQSTTFNNMQQHIILSNAQPSTINNVASIAYIVDPLKAEIMHLQRELAVANEKLTRMSGGAYSDGSGRSCSVSDEEEVGIREEEEEDVGEKMRKKNLTHDCLGMVIDIEKIPEPKLNPNDIKYGNIVPIHKSITSHMPQNNKMPVTESTKASPPTTPIIISKMAARRRLKKTSESSDVQQHNLQNSAQNNPTNKDDLSQEQSMVKVVDNFVDDVMNQCDGENEKLAMQIEMARLRAKLEHSRAQNSVYLLTLSETKAHCDRLALLCGKYESNAVALHLALGVNDRAIEAYDVLLALLETELTMDDSSSVSMDNRNSAETVAKQLLHYLNTMDNTDLLLSPWQGQIYSSPTVENQSPWTTEDENKLREHVSILKAERSSIEGTCVSLESLQLESAPTKSSATIHEYRKFDMEMAVLIQELTYCREEKSDLLSKMFLMEKQMNANDLKLKYVEGQQKAQSAALKNLQGQLKDTEALLNIASQQKERGFTEAEHAEGIEKELVLALARESRLKVRLHELVSTLDQVTKNAEARLHEGRDIVEDLRQNNAILADTIDKNNKKYLTKYKKMEQQISSMVEKHHAQIQLLQQRLAYFEKPSTKNSDIENSIKSGIV